MKKFKAGIYIQQDHYKSFQPEFINRQWALENMEEIIVLLSRADQELGRLDMYSKYIPNIEISISMNVLKEATKSSKIEGTQTDIEEALLDKEDVPLDKRNDWEEVQNYIQAMAEGMKMLETLPLSSRFIKQTHRILMQGVRGEQKNPGEFRRSQNWIGGANINDAIFVPPVHTSINDLVSDLEKFIYNKKIYIPELLKIAIIHYQFETIHPFLDGNGRVGRLLIPLYLVCKDILKKPILYLSDYLEKNRIHYYDSLMNVREKNDIDQWFKFFLYGIIKTAEKGKDTFDNILQLQKENDLKIQNLGSRASNAQKVTNYLYVKPMISAKKVSELTELSLPSAYKLIEELEKSDILKEITGAQRKRIYIFEKYIKLFQD
ncbi:MAG: Fic family protein [Deltaproteobacteria bacterium]|nr:Fic family protein [Deltaproteobacteria bacterium]